MDSTVTYTDCTEKWVQSTVGRKGGGAESLCSTRLISDALFASLVQAEEEWSLCGMSAAKGKKQKTKNPPPLWWGCVSEQLNTHKHTPSQTRLKHILPFFTSLPTRSTHSPTQTYTSTFRPSPIHPHINPTHKSYFGAKNENLRVHVTMWSICPRQQRTQDSDTLQRRLWQVCFFYLLPVTLSPCSIPPVAPLENTPLSCPLGQLHTHAHTTTHPGEPCVRHLEPTSKIFTHALTFQLCSCAGRI